jgi:O-succinylbenzoic acid--CoA ligase
MDHAFGVAPGELLAVEMPPGPAWVDVIRRCWTSGVTLLPLDVRMAPGERAAILDRARPAGIVDAGGETTAFAGSVPVLPDTAVVMATSGTGGEPRLAELSRSAVEAAVEGSTRALRAGDGALVSCLPPSHVGGLLVLLRGELGGSPLVVLEGFDAEAVAGIDGGIVSVVPTMVARLVAASVELAGLTLLVGGGALATDLEAAAIARGARVIATYGLTESCGGVVYDGVPFEATEARVEPEGDVLLRGPTLMEGYRGDPAATGAAFTVEGWLRTGDLGELDDRGLRVLGRRDEVIRTGGEQVWPQEVERRLAAHPKVRDVVVRGAPHPEWGSEVVAGVVPTSIADPPTLEELRGWTRDELSPFKAPRRLELIAEVPRTRSGKIRRSRD